jgi:uncharacterized RDD family membrane protein YckC
VTPESPYAPPRAPLLREPGAPATESLATAGQRFGDYAVDSLVLMLLNVPFGLAPGLFHAFFASIAADFGYFLLMEAFFGATLGKVVTGVRVVSEDGARASFGQIAKRSLARFIPFEAFSFIGSRDGRPVGWHDSLSRTRVIRVR